MGATQPQPETITSILKTLDTVDTAGTPDSLGDMDAPHTVSSAPEAIVASAPEPDIRTTPDTPDMPDTAPTQPLQQVTAVEEVEEVEEANHHNGKNHAGNDTPSVDTPSPRHAPRRPHGPRWHEYTAFVLSGGGARGALQVGALRALLERGITPDVVIGTSIGAWNGAWLANDPTLEGVEKLAEIWRGLRAEQLLLGYESFRAPASALANILVAAAAAPRLMMGYSSFYSDVGLKRLIRRCVGDATFADLKAKLRIVATDLTHGVRAVFSEGPLAPPILASSAIPAIFPPVRIGDSVYADGCALDSCSIETALNLGARRLFVLSVGYDGAEEDGQYWSQTLAPVPVAEAAPAQSGSRHTATHAQNHTQSHGIAAIFERVTQVMGYYQLNQALQRIPRGIETHVINLPSHHSGGMLDFDAAGRWMDDAYLFARDFLNQELGPMPLKPAEPVAQEEKVALGVELAS